MNIVANSYFLHNLRKLEFFTLDLGKSKKIVEKNKTSNKSVFRKLSEFEVKYTNLYNRSVNIYGNIGKATFYEDVMLKKNVYLIFNGDDIYEIEWTDDDIKDFKNYILESLRKVHEINNDSNNINNHDNTWESNNEKNNKKSYLINQELSKEEYRMELLRLKELKKI